MRYLSLFSGIEACSVAWAPLGWECAAVAEIEPWPSRALAHHYPDVPNLGDVTKVTEEQIAALGRIDVVVFGSPCQDLGVAGKRKGLDGARSGLFFTAMQIVGWARQWCDCRFALWENVPGAFSSNRGRDFAAVVDAMAGLEGTEVPPKGWGTEGCALGAEAMVEWSTLDAQWFGVAQRRRRVFAIADFGDWRNRPPILLEPEGLRGDTAPSREARQVAPTIPARSLGGGGLGTDFDCDGGLIQAYGGNNQSGPIDVATARNACASASGRMDFETETFLVAPVATAIRTANTSANGHGISDELAHTLDGAQGQCVAFDTTQITSAANRSNPQPGDPCHQLAAGAHAPAIAFPANLSATQHASTVNLSPALGAKNPTAVAVALRGREGGATAELGDEVQNCLRASSGGGDKPHVLAPAVRDISQTLTSNYGKQVDSSDTALGPNVVFPEMQVRRMTPTEAERLQGFPDGYTAIPWRGKPADQCPDGPRYKALGNSMAVPVMQWIGQQIDYAMIWSTP